MTEVRAIEVVRNCKMEVILIDGSVVFAPRAFREGAFRVMPNPEGVPRLLNLLLLLWIRLFFLARPPACRIVWCRRVPCRVNYIVCVTEPLTQAVLILSAAEALSDTTAGQLIHKPAHLDA